MVVAVMRAFAEHTNALGLEGLRNSFNKLQTRGPHPPKFTNNAQKMNRTKCRYNDVPCLDNSRVLLKPWPEGQGDFIHANWLTDSILENKFICTQGPLEQTCGDFWRMIWQENVQLIIMLCRTCENNRQKCAQYWPLYPGQVLTFCGISIRAVEKRSSDPDVHCTALLMTYRGEKRSLAHYQWVSWPDKFVPHQLTVPFTLLSSARARKTPTVIHCSAGIGRTGTLVVLEMVAKTLLACRLPEVLEIIWSARSQRSRVVQNEEQFFYIHYLTIQRLVNKGIVSDKSVSKFCREYEHFYFTRTHKVQIPLPVYVRKRVPSPRKIAPGAAVPIPVQTLESVTIPTVPSSAPSISPQKTPPTVQVTTTPKTAVGTTSLSGEARKALQAKRKKTARKKKTIVEAESAEESPIQTQTVDTTTAMPSRSQADLQQQYREAQNALLESYRKAQMALLQSYEKKQRMIDGNLLPVEDNAIETAKKGQSAIAEVSTATCVGGPAAEPPESQKTAMEPAPVEIEAAKAGEAEEPPASTYAFPTEEIRKIKQLEEIKPSKEDLVDRAEYVFMQPIYARTYGALQTPDGNPDMVEKYVMNMLPEKYFNSEVDDGAEYAAGVPPIKNTEFKDSSESSHP